jgi:hypothetical protein
MSNWIVTFKKASHLDERQYLVAPEDIPALLRQLLARYPDYAPEDSITIRPTEMIHYE